MNDDERLGQAVRESQVPPPSDGLAARVTAEILAAAVRTTPPTRWSMRASLRSLGLVALGAALAGLYSARARLIPVAEGGRQSTARETVAIGRRARIVLEAGADVRWRAGVGGGLNVVQAQGTAFYRVDAGPLSVETPSGTVVVKGTCFRVEVKPMNQTTKLASGTSGGVWKGAVAGAAVATITLVTVYEGRVSLAARQGALQLEAGESAQLAPGTAPERLSRDEPDNREVARLAQATAALRSLPRLAVPPAPPPSPKADAERPSYDDLPPVIRAVVKQVAQGRQVQNFKAKREEYKGQPTFNLDFDVDGTNHELEVDDSGRVVHAEIDLDPSDLPPAVAAVVASRYPKAPLIDAELNQKPDQPRYYEIHIRLDGQVHELNITEDAVTVMERSNCPHSGR